MDAGALEARAIEISGGGADGCTVLRSRPDSSTMRVTCADGSSVVMKFWERRGVKSGLRRLSRTTPAWREQLAMERMWDRGVPVPRPLAHFFIGGENPRFSDVLVMEDLGNVRTAFVCMKESIAAGRTDEATTLEQQVIDLTARIVRAGVVDPDHSLNNIVRSGDGRLYRIDFELARVAPAHLRPALYAGMISRLLGSFVFAVQPDAGRVERFAGALATELSPPARVLRSARDMTEDSLRRQQEAKGIPLTLPIDW